MSPVSEKTQNKGEHARKAGQAGQSGEFRSGLEIRLEIAMAEAFGSLLFPFSL